MARKKKPLAKLQHIVDKGIHNLDSNSQDIEKILEQLVKVADTNNITEEDKLELQQLEEEIKFLEDVIDKIVGENNGRF